jgi:glutamine amidotransferase-like uncharacterized protein
MFPSSPPRVRIGRRGLLRAAVPVGLLAAAASCGRGAPPPAADPGGGIALVYRGPASCDGCSEAVAALLSLAVPGLQVAYCGPGERTALSARSLAGAAMYAQPGGDDLGPAWTVMRGHAADIRAFVRGGGCYLGFCLGGYLAGFDPGFGLLPGDSGEYTTSPGASVRTTDNTVVALRWRGRLRHAFFQDGPLFTLDAGKATVLATYTTGPVAAAVAAYGAGRVGVVGPHPEADVSWYADNGLTNPDGIQVDLGRDFVRTALGRAAG